MNSEDKLRLAAGWCNDMRDPLEIAMNKWSGLNRQNLVWTRYRLAMRKIYCDFASGIAFSQRGAGSGTSQMPNAQCQITKSFKRISARGKKGAQTSRICV